MDQKPYYTDDLDRLCGPGIAVPVDYEIWYTRVNLMALAKTAYDAGFADAVLRLEKLKR